MKIKVGSKLSRIQYVEVTSETTLGVALKCLDTDMTWQVSAEIMKQFVHSTEFATTEKVTRTTLAEILGKANGKIMQVKFKVQPKIDDLINIAYSEDGKSKSKAAIKKEAKTFGGKERTMVCHILGTENVFGRSLALDLEAKKGDGKHDARTRLIDHRSLQQIIFNGVKYELK